MGQAFALLEGQIGALPEHCARTGQKMTDWAGNRGGEVPFELPDDLVHALKSFCTEADATMFMTLLSLFGACSTAILMSARSWSGRLLPIATIQKSKVSSDTLSIYCRFAWT